MKGIALFIVSLCASSTLLLAQKTSSLTKDVTSSKRPVFCYWGTWSHYRSGAGKFSVGQIDPSLCTHLVYAFAKLENGVIAAFDAYLDLKDNYGLGMYEKVNKLKVTHPHLKTLLAIGGWNEGSQKYSQMASSPEGRQRFAQSVLSFLDKHGFDGLDLDWEYPAARGGVPQDKQNFVLLIQELRKVLGPGRLLTAAVSAGESTVDGAYDVPAITRYLDYISVMAYDFFGAWNSYTGHCSPLGVRENASEEEKKLNVETAIRMWLNKGADPNKLLLGMPLYGRTFTLANPSNNGFLAPTVGPGPAGPVTGESGYLGYNEICTQLKTSKDWKITRDPRVVAPVAVKGNLWIGYDDAQSLTAKVLFARSLGLAGAMVWSIETDDFSGTCGGTKNPLLRAIRDTLESNATIPLPTTVTKLPSTTPAKSTPAKTVSTTGTNLPSTTPAKSTAAETVSTTGTNLQSTTSAASKPGTDAGVSVLTTSVPTTTATPELACPADGFYPYPNDPHRFYRCVSLPDGTYAIYVFDCPAGTVFNPSVSVCTF
ncbi:chitinase-3-like protein 1 isoform X1 [Rhipicephalus sanguineus]|uniref:chitinase-3-like protein 1 isoform X1 n=1 Tax=Rhipicephalus sanguineus TaxID=34632 RepID=UPI001894D5D0|nr:chitinase-3-like protein 1 isoform X1 [Rhipicephalus sanguineus]